MSDLVTAATRLADRLRVVGPRLAAREGEVAAQTLGTVRDVLQRLADLGADAEGAPRRPVPVLGAHALGDQVLVLAHDLATAGDDEACREGERVVRELAARL
jgi:hypothetical protein